VSPALATTSSSGVAAKPRSPKRAKKTSPKEIFNHLKKEKIEIDVLVNNAGFGSRGTVSELDTDLQVDMVQVNAAALTHLTSLFLPGIIERGQGGILNVG
jgi:hypothetical protein